MLDLNLAGELGDEFAEWAELLVLIAHNFDESVAIS